MIGALAGGAFVDKGGAVVVQLALAASAPSNHNSHENDDGDDAKNTQNGRFGGYRKWHLGCPNQNSKTTFQYKYPP